MAKRKGRNEQMKECKWKN